MSALSNLTQTTGSSTTTLPDWYNTAQQNLVSNATNIANTAPQLGQTVAQGAINTLSGANNPFTTSTNTLQSIAAGAANPWITDATTGAVTPNTNTALGGLFAAQQNELNQLLPGKVAPTEAGNIASGNFGSLRGLTADQAVKANALATMQTAQDQAALTNQQTGVSAAANAGNVAQQGITNAMNVGQEQMTAPFTSQANLGNILASVNVPNTVNTVQTPSMLQSVTGLGSAIQGGLNALYGGSGTNPVLAKLGTAISGGLNSLFGSSGTSGTDTTATGGLNTNNGLSSSDAATTAAMQNGYDFNPESNTYTDPATGNTYTYNAQTGGFDSAISPTITDVNTPTSDTNVGGDNTSIV